MCPESLEGVNTTGGVLLYLHSFGIKSSIVFCIVLGLGGPEFVIFTALIGKQLGMGALLDDCALMEHSDLIAELAAGQAVRDVDRGFITGDVVEL